ncbi:hypothetical protein N7481_009188 [Penicillium waksmanii]|uniref:uncharacterized protein n=1 Tax=Penicillium waksmanii TaxID=69791 RepID=UPI0025493F84|nr:uncharacterized protein N7481_009188 [Penicillium waksmanii]KAJ5975481.1 hypothetical protein N7481_009188 [Penicillium waksmanii]
MFNTIFSLSFLMVFLLPFMFNWTTNLNAAFFWLTWTTFVFSFSPTRVEILGTIIVRVIFYALPSTLMFLFDMFLPAAAAAFKWRGVEGLPGGRKTLNLRRREFKVAGWSLFNIATSIVLQGTLELLFHHTLGRKTMLKVSSFIPFPGTWAKHLLLGLALRGLISYLLHRFVLHNERSPFLSRRHGTWHHCLRVPYPLTAHYDHPLPYLVHKFIPMYLPAALFRFHALVFFVYLAIISLEELFSHCGYRFYPVRGLAGIGARVEKHLDDGHCNYSPWGFWDLLAGTYKGDGGDDDDDHHHYDHYNEGYGCGSLGSQRGGGGDGGKSGKGGKGGSSKSTKWGPTITTKRS